MSLSFPLLCALCLFSIDIGRVSALDLDAFHAELDRLAQQVESQVIAWRRDIHQHPELSNREFRTAKIVAKHLTKLGMDVQTGIAHTGVVGILHGSPDGPVVALRADMDALPITEATGLPFASKVRDTWEGEEVGVMHACGHDAHTAILMGVAEVLSEVRDCLPGTVKFIFQPAEEGPPEGEEGGAPLMIKEGALENPVPTAIFGLHVGLFPWRTINYRPHAMMAAQDDLRIVVYGREAHGAMSWMGVDAIVVAAQVVLGIQTIPSRQIPFTKAPASVALCTVHGGVRKNILPDKVEMVGTVRTFNMDMRQDIHRRIERTVSKIAQSAGTRAEVHLQAVNPVTYNDRELIGQMSPTLERVAGKNKVDGNTPLIISSADFSNYQRRIPGLFFFLGTAPENVAPETLPSPHNPRFHVDESALIVGVRALSNLAVDYLFMQSESQ